jgi:hypothetical protein
MENDLILMINNAKRYNDPKPLLYKDACHLEKVINTTKTDLDSAMRSNRPYSGGVKSKEKKHKILRDIAEMDSLFTEPPHEDDVEDDVDEDEEEIEEDDVDDEDVTKCVHVFFLVQKSVAYRIGSPLLRLSAWPIKDKFFLGSHTPFRLYVSGSERLRKKLTLAYVSFLTLAYIR